MPNKAAFIDAEPPAPTIVNRFIDPAIDNKATDNDAEIEITFSIGS